MRVGSFLVLGLVRLTLAVASTHTLNMYRLPRSGDAYGYILTSPSTELYSGSPTISGNTYEIHGGAVQWYKTPMSLNTTARLPTIFQSIPTSTYSSFYQLGPEIYRMGVTAEHPYVVYFGGSSGAVSDSPLTAAGSEWICTSSTIAAHTGFGCTLNNNSAITVGTLSAPIQGSFWEISVDVPVAGAIDSLLALSCHLANQLQVESDSLDSIAQAAEHRRSDGKLFSVVFYTAGSLAFLGGTMATTVCAMWLWQPLGKSAVLKTPLDKHLRSKSRHMNLALWAGLHALAVTICMAVGQFPALFVLSAVLAMFLVLVSVGYGILQCCRARQRSKVEHLSELLAITSDSERQKPEMGASYEAQWGEDVADIDDEQTFVPETCPHVMSHKGLRRVYAIGLISMVVLVVVQLVLFFAWQNKQYYVWSREHNVRELEYQPGFVAKSLLLMYSWDSLATDLNYNVFAEIVTSYCKDKYRTSLSDKRVIKTNFIDRYNIDMTQYNPSDYTQYDSVNAWFIRHLATGVRPISTTSNVVVAPADSRMIMFTGIYSSTRFWVKSSRVDTPTMLDDDAMAATFNAGTMAIYRLAPQDYHRFHSPVAGTIRSIKSVGGTLFSVSADAAISKNAAFLNQRQVTIIDSPTHGTVAYVAIGATCVGSVVMTKSPGDHVALGEELGFMQFGSTVVLLFQSGQATFDADLVYNSAKHVETHVHMGTRNAIG